MRFSLFSRRVLIAAAALAILAPVAPAFPARNPHKRDTRAEVEAVDQQWRTAELANDTVAMDKLLSEDYLGVTAGGRVMTKVQQLDHMRNRQSELDRLEFSDVKVKLLGMNAAIVTSLAELDGTIDGRPIHGQFRSLRAYRHVPGAGWKIVNSQATPLRRLHPGAGEPADGR